MTLLERRHILRQMLHNWTQTLQIDEQSGESFITTEDIDRLNHELISVIEPSRISVFAHYISGQIRNLKVRIARVSISANLFHPL